MFEIDDLQDKDKDNGKEQVTDLVGRAIVKSRLMRSVFDDCLRVSFVPCDDDGVVD